MADKPLVGVLMGSESDAQVMDDAVKELTALGIAHEVNVLSAHRNPEGVREYALSAESRGLKVIIAGAGKAAALAGVVASMTDLPVIGVPMKTSDLGRPRLSSLHRADALRRARGHSGHKRSPQRRHLGREDTAGGRPDSACGRRRRLTMIERYSTPRMSAIWTDEARMTAWLEVEVAVCRAWGRLGKIPEDALEDIRVKASFDVQRVAEIEEVTQHDVIAFVSCVAENIGDASKYLHYGLTSSDVLDTGLALQLRAAGDAARRRDRASGQDTAAAGRGASRDHNDRPHAWGARRTHHLRHGAGPVGLRGASWSGAAARGHPTGVGGQDLGRGGHLRQRRPSGRRDHHGHAGPRSGPHLYSDSAARPARPLHGRPGPTGQHSGEDRRAGAPLPAHRGAGGRGVLRSGSEGLVGHAAQAQPHNLRAHLRPGSRHPLQHAGCLREHPAVARARHQPLQRRAGHTCPTAPSCCTTCSRRPAGS